MEKEVYEQEFEKGREKTKEIECAKETERVYERVRDIKRTDKSQ